MKGMFLATWISLRRPALLVALLELVVDDAGPGVAPEHRVEAFERFWRAEDARALPGSGLGLAIVADAAESHGGTARLEAAPTGGTRAVLALPGTRPTGT